MKEWSKALKNLSILTQLGLSLIMPLLLWAIGYTSPLFSLAWVVHV